MNKNSWKHKYFEKNSHELHTNILKNLEIEQYLKKVLEDHGFKLHNYKINFSNSFINVLLSIYKTNKQNLINKKILLKNKLLLSDVNEKLKNYYKKKSIKNLPTKINYVKTLKLYKNYLTKFEKNNQKKTKKLDNLSKKIIKTLNLFVKNKFNIVLTIQQINFVNSKIEQIQMNVRKFEKTPFFTEGTSLLLPIVTQNNSAKLLSDFIASQLKTKRHNFFLNFLKESLKLVVNQKFSKIKGLKIIVKGRLNNASRSRHSIITIGKVPLIEIRSKINYAESVAFTSNGTLGIKVWICEKI